MQPRGRESPQVAQATATLLICSRMALHLNGGGSPLRDPSCSGLASSCEVLVLSFAVARGGPKKTAHRNYGPGPSRAQPLAGRILLSEADGYFGASVGPIWDQVWINLGPSVGQVWIKCEPIWSHSWTKFGQMWAESGPMLGQFETMFF